MPGATLPNLEELFSKLPMELFYCMTKFACNSSVLGTVIIIIKNIEYSMSELMVLVPIQLSVSWKFLLFESQLGLPEDFVKLSLWSHSSGNTSFSKF